jgi:hypothetical protein
MLFMSRKAECQNCKRRVNERQLKSLRKGESPKLCARCRGKIALSSFEPTASPRRSDYGEELNRYADCMDEIKKRTEVIFRIIQGGVRTGYGLADVETACLQMRKILELIALASLVANKHEYSQQYAKFAENWRATQILEEIEAINPNFWPVPSKQVIDPETGKVKSVAPVTSCYLTQDEFASIYDQCSEFLHARNPYALPLDLSIATTRMALWVERMMNLLNHHQIQLVNPDLQIWVLMRDKDDGKVKTFLMARSAVLPTSA